MVQEGSFDLVAEKNGVAAMVASRGALIGELALLTETKRPVTAVAREPSSVVRIPRQLFLKTLEGYPEAAVRMRDALASRVSRPRASSPGCARFWPAHRCASESPRGRGRAPPACAENPAA